MLHFVARINYKFPMPDINADYRVILHSELNSRKLKNSQYSLRAFSKHLEIDPSYLSKLIAGKLIASVDLADSLAKKLKLNHEQYSQFVLSAAEENKCQSLYEVNPDLTDCDQDKVLL